MPFRFRKHKGHDLAYDVKIMTSQQRLSRIVTSKFCRTMFVDIQTAYELCFGEAYFVYFESCYFSCENTNIDVSVFMFDFTYLRMINISSECEYD
jgi:hypothetical protein